MNKSLFAVFAAAITLTACGGGGGDGPTTQVSPGNGTGAIPAPACSITASPTAINQGNASTLSWNTTNASSVTIDHGIERVAFTGSQSVTPAFTSTYTLTATGLGGTKVCSLSVVVIPTPPPQVVDATLRMEGGVVEVSAGGADTVTLSVRCPLISVGSARCAKQVGPVMLAINLPGNLPLTMGEVTYNGRTISPGVPFSLDEAGFIKVGFTVGLLATAGQTATVTATATTSGPTTVEVVGTPTTVKAVREAAKITNASPFTFSKVGFGEIGGFDVLCPSDTAPQGCMVKGMTHSLTLNGGAVAPGQKVETHIGPTTWWQYETLGGVTTYPMYSPHKVVAGTVVRISFWSTLTQGTVTLTNLEFVRAIDGTPVPIILPTNSCSTIFAGFGCKG